MGSFISFGEKKSRYRLCSRRKKTWYTGLSINTPKIIQVIFSQNNGVLPVWQPQPHSNTRTREKYWSHDNSLNGVAHDNWILSFSENSKGVHDTLVIFHIQSGVNQPQWQINQAKVSIILGNFGNYQIHCFSVYLNSFPFCASKFNANQVTRKPLVRGRRCVTVKS